MPGVTPLRPDDVRQARAWAAFVADDARATAPPALEARVLLAAQAAMASKPRGDLDRQRRRWMAAVSAMAATVLAAAAWWLAPAASQAPRTTSAPATAASAAATHAAPAAATPTDLADAPGRPMPMTNVEAGRLLATPPDRVLAARPLFDSPGTGPVRIGQLPRGRSFSAPTVEPVGTRLHPTPGQAIVAPAMAGAPIAPAAPSAPTVPETWATRGSQGLFDPETGDKPAPAPVLLEKAAPLPPKDAPPAPPR
jgi:hypothetical protein